MSVIDIQAVYGDTQFLQQRKNIGVSFAGDFKMRSFPSREVGLGFAGGGGVPHVDDFDVILGQFNGHANEYGTRGYGR